MEQERINHLIQEACVNNSCPELADKVKIEWSSRMTSCMGMAFYKKNLIRLSIPVFKLAEIEDQEQTLVHEACHLIARLKNPNCKSHGYEWKIAMVKAGRKPERCHAVDCSSLRRTRKVNRYPYECISCGKQFSISSIKHSRLQKNPEYYVCGKCHSSIRLV